ncbi:16978_t:CDS:2 [Funneliformis caledonium]|uniref:16978_t:CDS:1 n=1 Tax=Funneliformis caledonium TaxID=1117310 RepID=A0A9N8YPJ0_9GLOM|nr:16978_t:CDS:2 [Funneliformis caledonium]
MMKVGTYLIKRLKELGIKHVFGVPGDFNMDILDYVEDEEGIEWIGGCNELNSGYAADGYARINKISALITTFGVGELSAINAIAGSFSEIVPVVHIVGTPSTKSQSEGAILHHTLGNGDFKIYKRIQVTVQEISTMIRHNIQPIIFILNNEGYTIERTLHGLKREYNDIQQWDFCKTLEYFGGAGKGNSVRISTKDEVGSFIHQFSPDKIQIVEVIMDKFDVPRALFETVKITYTQHVYEEKSE